MALPDGAASVWAVATRITALDANGFVDPGAASYVTEQAMKVTLAPVLETGDDVSVKNAAGNLAVFAKHADIPKYANVTLDMGIPEPTIEQICAGGTLLSSAAVALGEPGAPVVTPQTTLGTLAAATYGYRTTQYNAFGESKATADVSAAVASGVTGTVIISSAPAATALGVRVYGRTIGLEQLLGTIPAIAKPKLSAAIAAKAAKAGVPTNFAVTALTKSIPTGTTFQVVGDTNSPKLTFTTTAFAAEGAVTIRAESNIENTLEIAAAELTPVFVDTGAVTPSGNIPTVDTTAGPGTAGYQQPALGTVANENGVSIEMWAQAIVGGTRAGTLPFWWYVLPKVTGMHTLPKDVTNANAATNMEGQAFQNPNWLKGPREDWPFDSSKWMQRTRCGEQVVPKASLANIPAL